MTLPAGLGPSFRHLDRLTDAGGLHEHACGTVPRPEHAYCVDDVARGLLVTARQPGGDPRVTRLRRQYLDFVVAAVTEDGRVHNRRGKDGLWHDRPSVEDCWGRALHGLGVVVGAPHDGVGPEERDRALAAFDRAAPRRSPHLRASALAALGAVEVLRTRPDHPPAADLLAAVSDDLWQRVQPAGSGLGARTGWLWPEPRLGYGNAVVAEALVAAGHALGRTDLLAHGLHLLGWLLEVQTLDGHLSVVPVGGRGPGETGPSFDQQPIEVGVLADACARAHDLTAQAAWADGLAAAEAWFLGDNDRGTVLLDPVTGGGYDGLMAHGRNENQGAESTLAALATLQQAGRLRTGMLAA